VRKYPNLTISIAVAVLLLVAGFQGQRVDNERRAHEFYNWIVSAADRMGREGDIVPDDVEIDLPNVADETFFNELEQAYEPLLPEPPETAVVTAEASRDQSKLVRTVRNIETGEVRDFTVWELARSPQFREYREQYADLKQKDRLYTAVREFGVADMYGEGAVTASLGNIFFGFRKMAANLLWLQTDEYFHSGESHLLLPTIRTVVALDPQFVDAYLIGAWHIAYNLTANLKPTPEPEKRWSSRYEAWVGPQETYYYEAIDLLKDGIRNNPRNYRLYFDLGYGIYEVKLNDHEEAAKYLSEAVRYRHEAWAARTLYRILMYAGRYEEAIDGWRHYLDAYDPDFFAAPRFIMYNQAFIAEREGDQARAQFRDAVARGDEEQAAEFKAEYEQHYDDAREIWRNVIQEFGQDPLAQSRLYIMEANELAEEEKFFEAVAILEQARSIVPPEYFQEVLDLMIEIKQRGDIPLNLSERTQLLRERDTERALEQRQAVVEATAEGGPDATVRGRTNITLPMLLLALVAAGALVYVGVTLYRQRA